MRIEDFLNDDKEKDKNPKLIIDRKEKPKSKGREELEKEHNKRRESDGA